MLLITVSTHAKLRVVYPNEEGRADQNYGAQVLALALAKSGIPYTLTIHPDRVNQERARLMIEEEQISVYDFGTSADFEQRLLPVYFPIDRGLLGYRLCVIHRDNAAAFASITSLDQLRAKTAGQGVNWSDTAILRYAGITVHVAPWESLFKMVESKRFDFFPLGVMEASTLLNESKALAPNAIVEPHLVLIYPFGRLFFVRKDNTALRDAIQSGLEQAFADGSFQQLLEDFWSLSLTTVNLKERIQIRISNPTLTPAFLNIPRQYFYDMEK
jgi:ABC-type amino acid transport substrate-binding protein